MRVIVGDSVYEDVTVTVNDEMIYVEFAAPDLDSVSIPLAAVADQLVWRYEWQDVGRLLPVTYPPPPRSKP